MPNLFWEVKTLVCDVCRERPMVKVIQVSVGNWKGLCRECIPKGVEDEKEVKNDK